MVFIMPASATAKHYWSIVLLLFFSSICTVHASTFSITSAHVTQIGNGHVLNASIESPLSPRIVEAIDNGVPVIFLQEFKLIDRTPLLGIYWQWEETLWTTVIRHELRYHALSQQYILRDIGTDQQRPFSDINDALHALGKVRNLTLPPEHLTDTNHLILLLRSGIDLYALPTPMRPGALISSKWQLTSPWTPAQWH